MTAEEYIETRRCKDSISNKFDMCYMDAAYEAIEMARQEEREKAIKVLDIAIMSVFDSNTRSVTMGELREQFKRLLSE